MKIQCPTCGKEDEVSRDFDWRPFCSRRCKMVDLGNWLGEVYKFSRPLGPEDLTEDRALLSQMMVSRDDG